MSSGGLAQPEWSPCINLDSSQMNLVDLFAILPYFVNFIVDHLSGRHHVFKLNKVIEHFWID